jgi:hypothetical protein
MDFLSWKNIVLLTGIGRYRVNNRWYQRMIGVTNEDKNRNVIAIIGNAHLGTVSVNQLTGEQKKDNDIILGIIPHLVAEANTNTKQPFGKIHWGCAITPETTFKEKHTGLSKECDSNDNGHCNALEFIESTNAVYFKFKPDSIFTYDTANHKLTETLKSEIDRRELKLNKNENISPKCLSM